MRLDLYHHHDPEVVHRLDSMMRTLGRLIQQGELIVHTIAEFKDAIAKIDAETTRIGAKIDELVTKLKATGISEAEEHQVLDDLGTVADRLRTIGADPDVPVPPIP